MKAHRPRTRQRLPVPRDNSDKGEAIRCTFSTPRNRRPDGEQRRPGEEDTEALGSTGTTVPAADAELVYPRSMELKDLCKLP